MCFSKPEQNILHQLRQVDDESCKRDLDVWADCKHDIYAMVLWVNFRMSGTAENLQMNFMTRLWAQELVLPEGTNKGVIKLSGKYR